MNSEEMIAHLRERYTYDAGAGVVRNRKGQTVKGGANSKGYLRLNVIKNRSQTQVVYLHRLVWVLCYGRFPMAIDHINGDKKDNRLENLREVTQRENDANRLWTWRPNKKTGLPGVCQRDNGGFMINFDAKHYFFHDKYEAFVTLTMLGRMFRDV